MDEKEYLQTLGEQIVNPHARASILAEIQDHIEEQAQDYRASGMSEAVACRRLCGRWVIRFPPGKLSIRYTARSFPSLWLVWLSY